TSKTAGINPAARRMTRRLISKTLTRPAGFAPAAKHRESFALPAEPAIIPVVTFNSRRTHSLSWRSTHAPVASLSAGPGGAHADAGTGAGPVPQLRPPARRRADCAVAAHPRLPAAVHLLLQLRPVRLQLHAQPPELDAVH